MKGFLLFHQGWTDIILCIGLIFYNLNNYSNVVLLIREDSKDMIVNTILNMDNIKKALKNNEPKKVISVPGKVVNIVI